MTLYRLPITALVLLTGCFTPNLAAQTDTEETGGEASTVNTSESEPSTLGDTSGGTPTTTDDPAGTEATTGNAEGSTSFIPEETSTGTGVSSSTDASTGEPLPACGNGAVCLPDPEAPWLGPVAYYATEPGDPAYDCSAGTFSSTALEAVETPTGEDAECDCECGAPENLTHAGEATLGYYGSSNAPFSCAPQNLEWEVSFTGGGCEVLPESTPTTGIHLFSADPVPVSGGSCEAVPDTVVPDAVPGDTVRLCGDPTEVAGTCEGGQLCTALPDGVGVDVCVWRPGDHECPAGYQDKTLVFEGVADNRGCSACECGDPVGTVNATVRFFDALACGFPSAGDMQADGNCDNPNGEGDRRSALVSFTNTSEDAECSPSNVSPSGDIVGTNPATVCCVG